MHCHPPPSLTVTRARVRIQPNGNLLLFVDYYQIDHGEADYRVLNLLAVPVDPDSGKIVVGP